MFFDTILRYTAYRQKDRQTERQTDRQANRHKLNCKEVLGMFSDTILRYTA